MEDINYKIRFTDNTVENKNDITIPPNTINRSTDLVLHGRGSAHFGADNWSNMVRLLENFCSNGIEPVKPTEGQLWFNAVTKDLSVYTRKGINEYKWNKILIDGVSVDFLKLSDMDNILNAYVKKIGDKMTGSLIIPTERDIDTKIKITDNNNKFDAVTRDYVDQYIRDLDEKYKPALDGVSKKYIDRSLEAIESDRTMGNYLILPTEFKDNNTQELKDDYLKNSNVNNYAVTKRYVDSIAKVGGSSKLPLSSKNQLLHTDGANELEWIDDATYLKLSGGTMAGNLLLLDADRPDFKTGDKKLASSREYVDYKVSDEISKNKFVLPTGGKVGDFLKITDATSTPLGLGWGTLIAGLSESSLTENGYAVIGDLMICWGKFTPATWTYGITNKYLTHTENFAKAFSTCFTVIVSPSSILMNPDSTFANYEVDVRVRDILATSFIVRIAPIGDVTISVDINSPTTHYIAIGKK